MNIRTDLAMEAYEISYKNDDISEGIIKENYDSHGFEITKIHVLDKDAEKIIGKPIGKYFTINLNKLIERSGENFINLVLTISEVINELLQIENKQVLIAGLGNRFITPDAIGPKVTENILVTRHLIDNVPEHFGDFTSVSAISPGVLGLTGVESGEIIDGVIEKSGATCLIAVDALASRRLSRLLRTIQISDTGITPGSGVGNARFSLTRENLGIPVISIGVPTVVDGATLAYDIKEQSNNLNCEALDDLSQPLIITTKDIDSEVSSISKVIAYGINKALNPHLSIEDIDIFLS